MKAKLEAKWQPYMLDEKYFKSILKTPPWSGQKYIPMQGLGLN